MMLVRLSSTLGLDRVLEVSSCGIQEGKWTFSVLKQEVVIVSKWFS